MLCRQILVRSYREAINNASGSMLNARLVPTAIITIQIIFCLGDSPIVRKSPHWFIFVGIHSMYKFISDHFWYYPGKFVINLQKNENDPAIGRKTPRWVDIKLLRG